MPFTNVRLRRSQARRAHIQLEHGGLTRQWRLAPLDRRTRPPGAQLSKDTLALPYSQIDGVVPAQMLRKYTAIPHSGGKAEVQRVHTQVGFHLAPLCCVQEVRASRARFLPQSLQPAALKAAHPALH